MILSATKRVDILLFSFWLNISIRYISTSVIIKVFCDYQTNQNIMNGKQFFYYLLEKKVKYFRSMTKVIPLLPFG